MTQPAHIEQVAHLALQFGRLMLQNGADTDHVAADLQRFAAAFRAEANLLITYDALVVTIAHGTDFRTRLGHRVPGMNVGMGALYALQTTLLHAQQGAPPDRLQAELDAIEHAPPTYPHFLTIVGLALTAASLSRLFGGDWGAFAITAIAGAAETWFRLKLLSFRLNTLLVVFATALLGASIGGAGAALGLTDSATLCLVVPGMILVPGVPLINAIRDVLTAHATLGVSRLTFATALLVAIALGLLCATMITGVTIPVAAPTRVIGVPQDAVFSALAALGFAILFSVPDRLVWACMICGIASHTMRALLFHHGLDLIAGSLAGALAVGLLAQFFARRFDAPAVAFAFPGVVAMIPGVYAFRGVIGAVAIARGATNPALLTDTLSLLFTVLLMVGAIAIGVGAPMLLTPPRARPSSLRGGCEAPDAATQARPRE